MLANLIELNKIEVRLSKKYYGGISPKFYLRDLNKETLAEIPVAETCEDDICVKYYFKNVHIDLTHHYEMVDNYGLSAILQYVRLSELDDFDELFYYDGKLGPLYQKEKTTFKVWAPTALEVMVKVGNEAYQMERKEKGVFEVTIQGDLDNQEYNYLIRHHKSFHETLDLYAYASNANSNSNIVIDVDKINEPLYLENLPHMKRKTEAIIYELSVRDFTMSKTINATHPGTFMSLVESGLVTPQGNKAGFDYLVDLGVTHVQIMPMYDFATVDELHPTVMYNWGYDPIQYNVPEGSYALDPQDGYSRVKECRQLRFSPSNEIPRCSAKSTAFGIPTSDKSSTAGMLSDFARAVRSVIFPMYLSPELRGEYPSKECGLSSTVEAAVLPRSSTAGA